MPIRSMKPLFKQISVFVHRLAQESSIQSSELFSPPIGQQSWSYDNRQSNCLEFFRYLFLFLLRPSSKQLSCFTSEHKSWSKRLVCDRSSFVVFLGPSTRSPTLHSQDQNDEIARGKNESIESLVLESLDAPDARSSRAHVGAPPEDVPRVGWIQKFSLFAEAPEWNLFVTLVTVVTHAVQLYPIIFMLPSLAITCQGIRNG